MFFPSDVNSQISHASAPFDVVDHPVKVVPVPENAWQEDAPTTFPQQGWVDFSDGERGLCLISQGLPEYEVIDADRHEIAITLLRAVGNLGAGYDMQTAVVGAGPNIATPEAQIQRKLVYSLSLLPHTGAWEQAGVWKQAMAFNNPPRAYTTSMEKNRPSLPPSTRSANYSFFSVTGRNVVLSSVKKAEIGQALVMRLYNPSNQKTVADIHLPFIPASIRLCGLDESPESARGTESTPINISDGEVHLTLSPKKIVTLWMERK
jgi:alpha-mannosidase